MGFGLNQIFADFAKNLDKNAEELNSQEFVTATPHVELLPDITEDTIEVERPFFLDNAVLYADAQAAQDSEKDIQKKYDIPQEIKDILDIAHPDPVYVADDTYDGGLVENLNEQHRKHMSVVNKMPSGNHIHLASLVEGLAKVANELEDAGAKFKVISEVDKVLENLKSTTSLAGSIMSEAFIVSTPVLIGTAILSVTGLTWQSLLGLQEGVLTDAKDLASYARSIKTEYPSTVQGTAIASSATKLVSLARQAQDLASAGKLSTDYFNSLNQMKAKIKKMVASLDQLAATTPSANPLRFVPTRNAIKNLKTSIDDAIGGVKKAARESKEVGAEKSVTPGSIDVEKEPKIPSSPPPKPKSNQEIRKIQQFINQNFKSIHGVTVLHSPIKVDGNFTAGDENDDTWAAMRAIAAFTRDQFASGTESLGEVTPTNLAKLDLTGWEKFFEGHKNAQRIMLAGSGISMPTFKY